MFSVHSIKQYEDKLFNLFKNELYGWKFWRQTYSL